MSRKELRSQSNNAMQNARFQTFSKLSLEKCRFYANLAPCEKMKFPENSTITTHCIEIVPRYCETDQAGVVHHTVYPVWFEMGRTELLRANGIAYKNLEKTGTFFVVTELNIKYRKPAFYDEKLLLTTTCNRMTNAKVEHSYQLKKAETSLLLAEGTSTLACLDTNGKVQKIPEFMYPKEKNLPSLK